VIGSSRIRRPVAWWTALLVAAVTPVEEVSPKPHAPMAGDVGSGPTTRVTRTRPTGEVVRTSVNTAPVE